ncbi:phospholipase A2 [Streptomyces sp. Q6]|uniref:Phospholipase A2 n=1 Tax=Streptomyces citrinus TaxID=3118173 RepID=A0ACD5A6B4_9ACTN
MTRPLTTTGPSAQRHGAAGRRHRSPGVSAWSAYGFDWSTAYRSTPPGNLLGFPFRTACARHAFGHRTGEAAGIFSANKARLDTVLCEDLKRVRAARSGVGAASRTSVAWAYDQAVDELGAVARGGILVGRYRPRPLSEHSRPDSVLTVRRQESTIGHAPRPFPPTAERGARPVPHPDPFARTEPGAPT